MIKEKVSLENYSIKKWIAEDSRDDDAMHWIWNELMGETAKGDTLDFVVITKNTDAEEKVFTGILKDKNGSQKAIIPAIYEITKDGIMDIVEYTGETAHSQVGFVYGTSSFGNTTITVDEKARKMFGI